jgi:hypothetical protein
MNKIVTWLSHGESIAILALIVTILTLVCSVIYNVIFKKTYKITKKEHDSRNANFSLYLIDTFRLLLKKKNKKYLCFNITINNKSITKFSYTAQLELEYIRDDDSKENIIINYRFLNIDSVKKLTLFSEDIRLDEKGSLSGWLVFEYPAEVLKPYRISKYQIRLRDVDGNEQRVEIFLIKDIIDEN